MSDLWTDERIVNRWREIRDDVKFDNCQDEAFALADEIRDDLQARIAELEAQLVAAQAEIAERDASFDLRWSADMEAIKQWQAATGKELTWPGHGDLCVWLMTQLDPDALTAAYLRGVADGKAKATRWEPVTISDHIHCDCEDDSCTNTLYIDGDLLTIENETGIWTVVLPDMYAVCRVAGEGGNG